MRPGAPTRTELTLPPLSRFADVDESLPGSSSRPLHLHFRALVEGMADAVYLVDTSGICIYANPAVGELLGHDPRALIGTDIHTVVHHSHADGSGYPKTACPIYRTAATGVACEVSDEVLWRVDGTPLLVDYRTRPLYANGRLAGGVATFSDATVRRDAVAQLTGILDTAGDAVVGVDDEGVVTDWNRAAVTLLGWSGDEAVGRAAVDLIAPERHRDAYARRLDALSGVPDRRFPHGPVELVTRRKDGQEITLELTIGRLRSAERPLCHFILRDVTERQATARSLERSEELHRLLTEQSADLITRHALDGRFLYVSPASDMLLGLAPVDLVGRNALELVHPDDLATLSAHVTGADIPDRVELTVRLRHRDGHWVWAEAVLTALRSEDGTVELQAHTRDITDRQLRDAEFQQASRLESVGRLAAGLAHEINTPIQFVGDNARFLAECCEDLVQLVLQYRELLGSSDSVAVPELRERARQAEEQVEFGYLQAEFPTAITQTLDGIDRINAIVRAMRTFSDPSEDAQDYGDLNDALQVTLVVARHRLDSVADVHVELADLPPVQFHIADLKQAFLNLLMNAADAIEETGRRGTISVVTSVDGGDVTVSVADTGPGIPDDVLPKIFDPFFTTKVVGKGAGQGLAVARSVVQDGHGGALLVSSQPGQGTTFSIRLPIHGLSRSE
jgi:PAS domain S-box-containing protein